MNGLAPENPNPNQLADALRDLVAADGGAIRRELTDLVAFPSVHGEEDKEEACRAAASYVQDAFAAAGVDLDAHVTVDGSIALTGHRPASGPNAASAPTVLLYSHYDVVPAGPVQEWTADPWTLTERHGRWYGRGTADCKGNLVMHLAALRALAALDASAGAPGADADVPSATTTPIDLPNIRVIVEGSEERGSAGLDDLIRTRPELFEADAILIADAGNVAVGTPTLVTTLRGSADVDVRVDTLAGPVHSGLFGGAAPDALQALVALLATLHDEHGRLSIDGLDSSQRWEGAPYAEDSFRADAGVLPDAELLSDDASAASVADLVWSRPAAIVTGIDCPPATNAVNAVPPTASAHINLRVPPGTDPKEAQAALIAHLENHVRPGVRVTITPDVTAAPFAANVEGRVVKHLEECLGAAYGEPALRTGMGGSIPLCATLLGAFPDADLALFGVEEPLSRIHSADESVDPREIRDIAVAEALFLATIR